MFDRILLLHLILHYSIFLLMTIFGQPEMEVSMGLHEPIGSCSQIVNQTTAFGKVFVYMRLHKSINFRYFHRK